MTKWAIYKNTVGLYAKEYIDTLEGCKDLIGGFYVKAEDLPLVVNDAGGRWKFNPDDKNFVEIIETESNKYPLTREQCFPMNSPDFAYGWLDPEGNTFNTDFQGHYRAAEMICEERYGKVYFPEDTLHKRGWIKISRPTPGAPGRKSGTTVIFSSSLRITKEQADTLIKLGHQSNPDFLELMAINEDRW